MAASRALEDLRRRLRALERQRAVSATGALPAENPATYPDGEDDDDFVGRPTMWSVPTLTPTEAMELRSESSASSSSSWSSSGDADGADGGEAVLEAVRERRQFCGAVVAAVAPAMMPAEVAAMILDGAVDVADCGDIPTCAYSTGEGRAPCYRLRWRLHDPTERRGTTVVACARCDRPVAVAGALIHGGGDYDDARAVAVSRRVVWSRNGHVPVLSQEDDHVARRHPASTWHNFRAVAADEFIVAGVARYEVTIRRLTAPRACISVGVVGKRAMVNYRNDWIPGHERDSAALVLLAAEPAGPVRSAGSVTPVVRGIVSQTAALQAKWTCCCLDKRKNDDSSSNNNNNNPNCPRCAGRGVTVAGTRLEGDEGLLREGDVVTLTVDAPACRLAINGRPLGSLTCPTDQPLRVAVGLFYANDTVEITRTFP